MPIDREASESSERCVYCPKMCRFSCPVGHESSRETLTPWGKMSLLSLSVDGAPVSFGLPDKLEALAQRARAVMQPHGHRTLDADTAETFYGCTGCLRCRTFCEHGNDVPHALYQGRAAAVVAGVAPAAARTVSERFKRNGHAQSGDVATAIDAIADEQPADDVGSAAFFAGCEAPLSSPASVSAALRAARRFGAPLALSRGASCCGRPLFEAGYRDDFREHVREAWSTLGEREVVVSSAACARALTEWAREVGVEPLGPVIHIAPYLARHLGPHLSAKPLNLSVTYHDPCHLGRGLGEYDAPRRLLSTALAGGIREAPTSREKSDCCGGSGILGKTFPDVARAMAMSRADELRTTGPGLVVTACPSCAESLRGAGLEVADVTEIVVRWIDGVDEHV